MLFRSYGFGVIRYIAPGINVLFRVSIVNVPLRPTKSEMLSESSTERYLVRKTVIESLKDVESCNILPNVLIICGSDTVIESVMNLLNDVDLDIESCNEVESVMILPKEVTLVIESSVDSESVIARLN